MNPQRLAIRKVIYLCIVAGLLFPLVLVSRPATPTSAGGKLAVLRAESQLGPAHFGEVDAGGETVRLASLGMQGFASMVLWNQAHEQKKTENWAAFENTLNKIAKIAPNFINVWKFQAHNLSFNLSAEFNDYRQRYEWVKKGIAFLKEGRKYNERDPRLLFEIGWFICQKVGKSDEHEQFRRMFEDEEKRDNWLVGKDWYLAAQRVVDESTRPPSIGMSRSIFHSQPGLAQIYYAMAIEEDGLPWDQLETMSLGAREATIAQRLRGWQLAWNGAADDWYRAPNSLGQRGFPIGQAFAVRFNEFSQYDRRLGQLAAQLYNLAPDAADELLLSRRDALFDSELAALRTQRAARTDEQRRFLAYAVPRVVLSHDLAERAPPEKRVEARRLADEVRIEDYRVDMTDRLMEPVRFDGWKMRAIAEAEPEAVAAHRAIAEAQRARQRGRLLPAKVLYEQAFQAWQALMTKHPGMFDEFYTSQDVMDYIAEYRALVVDELDGEFPKDFVLQRVLDAYLSGHKAEREFKKGH